MIKFKFNKLQQIFRPRIILLIQVYRELYIYIYLYKRHDTYMPALHVFHVQQNDKQDFTVFVISGVVLYKSQLLRFICTEE